MFRYSESLVAVTVALAAASGAPCSNSSDSPGYGLEPSCFQPLSTAPQGLWGRSRSPCPRWQMWQPVASYWSVCCCVFFPDPRLWDPEFKARSLQHSSQGTAPDSVVDGNLLNLYMKYHMHADLLRHCSLCATLDATAQWLSFWWSTWCCVFRGRLLMMAWKN